MKQRRTTYVTLASLLALRLTALESFAQSDPPATGKTITVNGMQMYFEAQGEGDPLLLLHGFSGTGNRSWGRFMPELSRHYRIIVPDLRGHGRSTNPTNEFTHRQAARDVYGLLDQLGLEKVKGISKDTFTDILFSFRQLSPESSALLLLNYEEDPSVLLAYWNAGQTGILLEPEQAAAILGYRNELLGQRDQGFWHVFLTKVAGTLECNDRTVRIQRPEVGDRRLRGNCAIAHALCEHGGFLF